MKKTNNQKHMVCGHIPWIEKKRGEKREKITKEKKKEKYFLGCYN